MPEIPKKRPPTASLTGEFALEIPMPSEIHWGRLALTLAVLLSKKAAILFGMDADWKMFTIMMLDSAADIAIGFFRKARKDKDGLGKG